MQIIQDRCQINNNNQQQQQQQQQQILLYCNNDCFTQRRRNTTFQRCNNDNNKFCSMVVLYVFFMIVIVIDCLWITCNPFVVTSFLPTTEAYTTIHKNPISFRHNIVKKQYHYHIYYNQKQQQQQYQDDRYHSYPTTTASTSTTICSSIHKRSWYTSEKYLNFLKQIRKHNFVSFLRQREKNNNNNNVPTTSLSFERQQQEDTECNNNNSNNLSVSTSTSTSTTVTSLSNFQIDTNIVNNENTPIVNDVFVVSSSSSLTIDNEEALQGKQQLEQQSDNDEQQQEQQQTQTIPNVKRKKIAIIFNTNARAVQNDMIQGAIDVFTEHNSNNSNNTNKTNSIDGTVYATSTDNELQTVITTIVTNIHDYELIIPVGGDGTVSAIIQLLCEQIQIQYNYNTIEQSIQQLPKFAYIPMGTGNGLGSVVSCELQSSSSIVNKVYNTFLKRRSKKIQQLQNLLRRIICVIEDDPTDTNNTNQQQQQDCTFPHDRVYEILEMPMINVIANSYNNDDNSKTAVTTTTTTPTNTSPVTTTTNSNTATSNNYLCFFAGIGFDSLMLNDYKSIKQWSSQSNIVFVKNTLSSVLGYCVALVIKTLPSAILYGKHQIKCIVYTDTTSTSTSTSDNSDPIDTCWWVDHRRGDFVRPVTDITSSISSSSSSVSSLVLSKPTLLYNGTMGILAAGTTPYYGGGLRLFPFARITHDKMHVRIGRIHPAIGFINIPQIFAGSYRDTSINDFGCLDFIGTNFNVIVLSSINNNNDNTIHNKDTDNNESNGLNSQLKQSILPEQQQQQQGSGYPFQHSGESVGLVNQFQLRVTKDKIKFLCLSPRRPNTG